MKFFIFEAQPQFYSESEKNLSPKIWMIFNFEARYLPNSWSNFADFFANC